MNKGVFVAVTVALLVLLVRVAGSPARAGEFATSGMSVAVFPVVADGGQVTGATLVSLQGLLESGLAADGVYSVVPAERVRELTEEGAFDACADRSCRILLGGTAGVDGFVETTVRSGGGTCKVVASVREVRTGSARAAFRVTGGCGASELRQSVKAAAAGLGRNFGQETVDEAVVADESGAGSGLDEKDSGGQTAAPVPEIPVEPLREHAWVRVEGSTFDMGSDAEWARPDSRPVRKVLVASFEIGETEVTNGQYQACVDDGKCTSPHWDDRTCYMVVDGRWKTGVLPKSFRSVNQPVVCVDRGQAEAYAAWVGAHLPTEAEWEYAARGAGQVRAWPWGDERATCDFAVMTDESSGCRLEHPWPVCATPAGRTVQGVCDMAGNVWEMVQDGYGSSYEGVPVDGSAGFPGAARQVIRGGCWRSGADKVRVTFRGSMGAGYRDGDVGFRVVRDIR